MGRRWREDEILLIHQCFNRTMRIEEVERLTGRAETAIRAKAKSLNIRLKKCRPKTHTGIVTCKGGGRRVKLHESATTWYVGPNESYYKSSGDRVGSPSSMGRLLLNTIKPVKAVKAVKTVKAVKAVKAVKTVKPIKPIKPVRPVTQEGAAK
ncbi:hypothetical protein NPL06_001957 [Salmonella enterica]|nr:hypothetical protein [Salmonella enterica]